MSILNSGMTPVCIWVTIFGKKMGVRPRTHLTLSEGAKAAEEFVRCLIELGDADMNSQRKKNKKLRETYCRQNPPTLVEIIKWSYTRVWR